MDSAESGRPAKKARVEASSGNTEHQKPSKDPRKRRARQTEFKRQQRRANLDHPQPESAHHRRDRELFGIDEDLEQETSLKPLHDEERQELKRRHMPKTFSQPSVLTVGDKGIFVTCDMGKEKKSLTDLADLVEDYIEKRKLMPDELLDPKALLNSRLERQSKKAGTVNVDNEESPVEEEEIDIESSIKAELSKHGEDSPANVKAFQLITLDVPCVSFLRFIPAGLVYDKVDVVDLVHTICADAAKGTGRIRSRFIKRLSPVVWFGKVLSNGLEKACEEVLPPTFKLEDDSEKKGVTFAIRPNTRNNDKISRTDLIKKLADEVERLGNGKHKVDLKGYQKGVLVEIYRGWIGMSVVDGASGEDGTGQSKYDIGYEALKRFNLSEIYAERIKKGEGKVTERNEEQGI